MRLFVAVDLSASARNAVRGAIYWLRRKPCLDGLTVRWVEIDRLHITLQFLGEIESPGAVATAGLFACRLRQKPFDAQLIGGGVFPLVGRPSVIWVGVDQRASQWFGLPEEVSTRLASIGFSLDSKPYHMPT